MVKLNKIKNLLMILSINTSFLQSADAFLMSENPSGSCVVGPLCINTPENIKNCTINLDEAQRMWMFEQVRGRVPEKYTLPINLISRINVKGKSLKIGEKVLILRTHFLLAGRIPKTHEAQPSEKACLVWFAMDNSGIYSAYCMRRDGAIFKFAEIDGMSKTSRTFPIHRMLVRGDQRLRVLPNFVVLGLTGKNSISIRDTTVYLRCNPNFKPSFCSNYKVLVEKLKEGFDTEKGRVFFNKAQGSFNNFEIPFEGERRNVVINGARGRILLYRSHESEAFRATFFFTQSKKNTEEFLLYGLRHTADGCYWDPYGVFNSKSLVILTQEKEGLIEYLKLAPRIIYVDQEGNRINTQSTDQDITEIDLTGVRLLPPPYLTLQGRASYYPRQGGITGIGAPPGLSLPEKVEGGNSSSYRFPKLFNPELYEILEKHLQQR